MINKIYGEVTYFFAVRNDRIAGKLQRLSDWCLTGSGWMPRPQRWASSGSIDGDKMIDSSFDRIMEWDDAYGVDKSSDPHIRIHQFCEMPIKYVRTEGQVAP